MQHAISYNNIIIINIYVQLLCKRYQYKHLPNHARAAVTSIPLWDIDINASVSPICAAVNISLVSSYNSVMMLYSTVTYTNNTTATVSSYTHACILFQTINIQTVELTILACRYSIAIQNPCLLSTDPLQLRAALYVHSQSSNCTTFENYCAILK